MTQHCENEPCKQAHPGVTKIGGHWFCKEAADAIRKEVQRRSGAGRFNTWQAMKRSN